MSLLEKARAGRRAAVASLFATAAQDTHSASIFDFGPAPLAPEVPTFTSVRIHGEVVRLTA